MGASVDTLVTSEPIAIAGCGTVCALGRGIASLEHAVLNNASGLRSCARFSGKGHQTDVVGGIAQGIWDELVANDPAHAEAFAFLLADCALRQAKEQAREILCRIPAERIGLVLSTTKAEISALEKLHASRSCSEVARRHLLLGLLAADLAAAHSAAGPVRCVSVACVSGLTALQLGSDLVRRQAADAVLVVGADALADFVLAGFSTLRSLEADGCKPFDQNRVGLSLGEGAGAIVLTARGKTPGPCWTIIGGGSSNDANHLTGPSRDGSGLALAIERALHRAQLAPAEICFVQAHGTGTLYNDRMESLALRTVFGERIPPFNSCKGMIGHTLGAAGLLETIFCIAAGNVRALPGTPGLRVRDPEVPPSVLADPLRNTTMRHVLKINSGFSGTNAALVLRREVA